ncbi:MAG: Fic family protein [Burkholderiales bacterium]|nr:Fic family protein [Burkholderiales bacterium]
MYLWQTPGWPGLTWDANALTAPLARARLAQGRMLGLAGSLGMVDLAQLQLSGWAQEAVATAQIEGEVLQINSVRASAARRLGLAHASAAARDARSEATLDVLQAAVGQWDRPLAEEDLFAWHAALFPTGRSGLTRIAAGEWRTHAEPMQIVTPRIGKPDLVHYQAPLSADVAAHMHVLLEWFNTVSVAHGIDGLVRAAVAHLWFEAIHPFEDGNGRIGRALAELALAQDMRSDKRLFSLSAQLAQHRAGYYAQLQAATGHARLDITPWLQWFTGRIEDAFVAATQQMQTALARNLYWAQVNGRQLDLSASQRKALARLLEAQPEGFAGGMSTEKYVNLTGTSRATAYRELTQLSEYGLLARTGQGRGTRYALVIPAQDHA